MKFEPQCKKQSDLHREWARVLDMCEGTEIHPNRCLKFEGIVFCEGNPLIRPSFDSGRMADYEFALALVEGKPVFRGDVLYWKNSGTKLNWVGGIPVQLLDFDALSWNPPRRTITINGVEMKAPKFVGYNYVYGNGTFTVNVEYMNQEDADAMKSALEGKQP